MRGLSLIGIEVAAFLLILAETYLFFMAIVPLGPVPHGITDYTTTAVAKVGATFGLGVLWLVVVETLTRLYVRERLKDQTPTASS